ncbi:hypothetical protein ACTVCO_01125 [Sanguibacter sp. A247]|uniref:hypothetical protein n=1 Tax=unclassified Sanguibacter TaxID=2645534 RepID=UPI003FD6DC97
MAWHPDPTGRAAWRLEDDNGWTPWLSDGSQTWHDPRPMHRPLGPGDALALAFVTDVFLPEAHAAGALDPARADALTAVVETLRAEVGGQAPAGAAAAVGPGVVQTPVAAPGAPEVAFAAPPSVVPSPAISGPAVSSPAVSSPAVPSPAPQPLATSTPGAITLSRVPAAERRTPQAYPPLGPPPARTPRPVPAWRRAVAASIAAHGLTYLGVVLLFVGVFGLVAFAFGDVRPSLRPVAELAAAAVPFIAAWQLRRGGATDVARALEVLGGLLLPLLVITSLVDGFQVPPDPRGGALVVALTVVPLACAGGYLVADRRRRGTALRHAVVPSLVLAAAMATIGVGRPLPTGQDVAEPSVWQAGAMALALALLAVVARVRGVAIGPSGPATLVVVTMLAALARAASDPQAGLVLATGAALVVALAAMRPALPPMLPDVAAPLAWAATVLAAGGTDGLLGEPGALGVVAAAGFLVLAEEAGRRGRPTVSLAIPVVGLGASTLTTLVEPWAATAVFAAVTAWALLRRTRPFAGTHQLFDIVGGAAPALGLIALGFATRPTIALGAAVVALAVALVPEREGYWRTWRRVGTLLVVLGAVVVHAWANNSPGATSADVWSVVAGLVVLGVLVAYGPFVPLARLWGASALLTWAWLTAAALLGLPIVVLAGVLALVGLAFVASNWTVGADGAGHALGVGALALVVARDPAMSWEERASDPTLAWAYALVLVAATAALAVSAVRLDRRESAIVLAPAPTPAPATSAALPPAPVAARRAPTPLAAPRLLWLLVTAGVPVSMLAVLDAAYASAGAVMPGWWPLAILASWALVIAAATHLIPASESSTSGEAEAPARRPMLGIALIAPRAAALVAMAAVVQRLAVGDTGWNAPDVTDLVLEAVAIAALVLVPVLLPVERRPRVVVNLAWAAVPFVVLDVAVASSAWLRGHMPETVSFVAAAVGALYVMGAAAVASREVWQAVHRVRAPYVYGHVLLVVAALLAPSGGAASSGVRDAALGAVLGATVLGAVALTLLASGVRCRTPWSLALGIVAAWAALLRAWPGLVDDHPWVALLAVTLLVAGAEALHRLHRFHPRWSIAILASASPIALTALDGELATHLATGVLAGAVAIVVARRGRPRSADAIAAAAVLVVSLALDAGTWAIVAATGLVTLTATGLALVRRDPGRALIGAAGAFATWGALIAATEPHAQQAAGLSLVTGAAIALVAASARVFARSFWPTAKDRAHLALAWWSTGLAIAVVGGIITLAVFRVDWPIVGGAALVVAALIAGALAWRDRRAVDAAAVVGALTTLAAGTAANLGPTAQVAVHAAAAALTAVAAVIVVVTVRGPARPVVALLSRALAVYSAAAIILAAFAAVYGTATQAADPLGSFDLDTSLPYAIILATAAVQVAAWGLGKNALPGQILSPILATGAWLVVAPHLTTGAAWSTVPVGLALLMVASLLRAERRRRVGALPGASSRVEPGGAPAPGSPTVRSTDPALDMILGAEAATELLGVAFLVGAFVVRAVDESVAWALAVLVIGAAIAVWGLTSKVRRRVMTGAALVLVAAVLLVGVPLVALLPGWGSAGAWLVVAGLGAIAVLGATVMERSRSAVTGMWRRLGDDTEGWE